MMFTKAFGLAAAFATLSSALPHAARSSNSTGDAGIEISNNLNGPIYLWSVGGHVSDMHTLESNGGSWSSTWKQLDGGGVSIKMATRPDQTDVLQFEYTKGDDNIWWDLSCINMGTKSEFTKYGFGVYPNKRGGDCESAVCKAGEKECADAYLTPYQDENTHACKVDTSFTMQIGKK